MLCVVLWGKGEVVHSLPLFQGYTVEDWLSAAAVQTVVRGNMDGLVGSYRLMEPVPGILWWWPLLLLHSVLIKLCPELFSPDAGRRKYTWRSCR